MKSSSRGNTSTASIRNRQDVLPRGESFDDDEDDDNFFDLNEREQEKPATKTPRKV
jgi:hypothetical protein